MRLLRRPELRSSSFSRRSASPPGSTVRSSQPPRRSLRRGIPARVVERARRLAPARGRPRRGPDDRRPADAVGRPARRDGEARDRGSRAALDGGGLRRAAAGADPARPPRPQRPARLQLRPRARRLLGRARPARGRRCSSTTPRWPASTRSAPPTRPRSPDARRGERRPRSRRSRFPGLDGTGVTIALLDTGVDLTHPYLGGRVEPGIDVVGGTGDGRRPARTRSTGRQVERHGTELAGVLVGSGGPGGLHGRRAGSLRAPDPGRRLAADRRAARDAVYARTRPADRRPRPRRRSRTATATRTTPRGSRCSASRSRSPRSPTAPRRRPSTGRSTLDMLVVAPAGNDGAAGPLFGSIAGPGGSPAALVGGRHRPAAVRPRPCAARAPPGARRARRRAAAAARHDRAGRIRSICRSPCRGAPGRPARQGGARSRPGTNPAATVRVAAVGTAPRPCSSTAGRCPAGSLRDFGVPVVGVASERSPVRR